MIIIIIIILFRKTRKTRKNGKNCNLELAEKLGKNSVFGPKGARIGQGDTKTGVLILKSREE